MYPYVSEPIGVESGGDGARGTIQILKDRTGKIHLRILGVGSEEQDEYLEVGSNDAFISALDKSV